MWQKDIVLSLLGIAFTALSIISCSKEASPPRTISILSMTVNGTTLTDDLTDVPVDASVVMVFSAGLQTDRFESALSITANNGVKMGEITYANESSRVTIKLGLDYGTTYHLTIEQEPIGRNGESLAARRSLTFTTVADGTIYRQAPCTNGTAECLRTLGLSGNAPANFNFYSSFPIYEPEAEWRDLTAAVIVVHGAGRNADDYFDYLIHALQSVTAEEEVVLLAPEFRQEQEAAEGDLYWSTDGWREGQQSAGVAKFSSFELVDQLIHRLGDRSHFPSLKKIIITGHSSGALFTQLYAAAGKAAVQYPELQFEYVVANSQYFYYPDGQRVDESTDRLYTPAGCTGYDFWPLGLKVTPPYLNGIAEMDFNERFVNSAVTYLLGNGAGPDGAFNTMDCYATLLGSSRYRRGENMFRYMELRYPGLHRHQRSVVAGVGHDGAGMYRSPEFAALLGTLLE